MSTSSDERLMQLFDHELDQEQAEALERRIADDPEAAQVLAGLHQVGDLLREAAEKHGALADDIAAQVMARIDAEDGSTSQPPALPAPRNVVPLAGRWRHAVPAVAGVLALAAAAVLVFWSGNRRHPTVEHARPALAQARQSKQVEIAPHVAAPGHQRATKHVDSSPAVAIETVDFGSHDGAIFMVSAGQESTPVVWLTDDSAEHGGRMKPL